MKKQKIGIFVLCLIAVYFFALIGSLLTSPSINSGWYESVKNNQLTPPNWVFPVVWNVLFFLIALSLYLLLAAKSSKNKKEKKKIILAFAINLILNVLWSFFFFYLKNPVLAFFELIILWFSILAMIIAAYRINRTSAYLLFPYIIWVSFASVLNFLIAFA